jgi:hypothetical protein
LGLVLAACVAGCGGPSDQDKAEVAKVATGWHISGGTLGQCLSKAGYDVSPDFVKGSVQSAIDKGWYRVGFISSGHDAVHVAVDLPDKRVVPYKAEDSKALSALGCGVYGDPYQ